MKTIIALILTCFTIFQVDAAKVKLEEAIKRKQIQVIATGNGGYQGRKLRLDVKNLTSTPLEVEVSAGIIFQSADEAEQNLIITKEEVFVMGPKGKSVTNLFTMCIQSHNLSPARKALFTFNRIAQGDLLKLAKLISEKNYQMSTAQSAVWAITDGGSIDEIYGSDTSMVRKLAEVVSGARDIDLNSFNFTPRAHTLTSIKTSIECLVPDYETSVALRAYNRSSGVMVRELFANQRFKPGFYQFKGGINHTLADTSTFELRLETDDKVIARKVAAITDTVPKLQEMPENFVSFNLPTSTRIRGGIYDADDNLYVLLAEKRPLRAGFNRIDFLKSRDLPHEKQYFFKIKDAEGKTLVSQEFKPSTGRKETFRNSTQRGNYRFKMNEGMSDLRIAVYDQHNRIIWMIADNSRLTKGAKNIPYMFQHRQGPDAPFTIKLTAKDGTVIDEQCVVNCR